MKIINKKINSRIVQWLLIFAIVISSNSCQKKLEALYLNPDGITQPTIEGLFLNVEQTPGLFRLAYNEMWHTWGDYFNPMLGAGGTSNPGGYATFSWGYDPYTNCYRWLESVAATNTAIGNLSSDQQTSYQPFTSALGIIQDFIFYRLTNDCGSVPYTDALQAQTAVYTPKFDNQQFIYSAILNDLKNISNSLKGAQLGNDAGAQLFAANDILFKGNLSRWRMFANSLRLRLALRLTNVEPDTAKAIIQDVLNDGQYVQTTADDITVVDSYSAANPNDGGSIVVFQAFRERRDVLWLPQQMLNVLQKAGQPIDPRLAVLFQPDANGAYTAMPKEGADIQAISSKITQSDPANTYPSIYNRTTYETNFAMPQPILTSTEVHLIKAEAAIRWPDLGIDAATEYRLAIQASIDRYYAINIMNKAVAGNATTQPAKPAQTVIDDFLDVKVSEFNAAGTNEKEGLIYDQKYVDFNVMQTYELWNDTRRLFKELGARVINAPSNMKEMERTIYPTSESSNNHDNFAAVASDNNYTTPVWWTGR
ncbi:MAG: SusD/RagB family nutrient-binding outer membrane lipoprotein [Chitinophagaceae bacterium]|jgi:hypothetical protein|nr:SusD/RagB family nutrient-binding outer membrane lipoprotein [Chitinophagaceae bacterium]